MCLYKKHWFPKISRKPITVYKYCYTLPNNKIQTYVQNKTYFIGDTIKNRYPWLLGLFSSTIGGIGVHAFVDAPTAYVIETSILKVNGNKDWYVCEIPPYTPYWIGLNKDIAASRIKIIEKFQPCMNFIG